MVSPRAGYAARRTLLGALCLTAAGCISESKEQSLGDEMASDVNSQIALVRNPLLNAYVSSLGRMIAAVSERPELHYRFYIINSATVNAFALPGGHIYITRGLLERTDSGAELAGVLAHEIGHVVERHGIEKLQRHLRTGSLVNVLYSVTLGGEPGILQQNALRLTGFLWNASHSREDEEEADKLAVAYMVRAGVDPEGIVSLLQSLLAEEEGEQEADTTGVAAWFSTHPLTASRIALARREIRTELHQEANSKQASVEQTFQSYPAFLRVLSALPPPPDDSE